MNSHAPCAAKPSISSWATARMTGRSASTARGVKALLTRWRSRACCSPSMLRMLIRIQSANEPCRDPLGGEGLHAALPQAAITQQGRHLVVAEDRVAQRRARVPTRLAGGVDLRRVGLEGRIEQIKEGDLLVSLLVGTWISPCRHATPPVLVATTTSAAINRPEHPGKFQQRRVGPSWANQR